ncbi:unnamed protein product [Closterium sp. NIES-53]
MNIMKNRWVLTMKYHIDDTVERKKARLVVKGFMQVYGADYDKTYAPVSSYVTLRIFLSIVAVLNLNLMQLDMKSNFLKSKLDRVLYMYQLDYFNDGTGRVCKLLKSLYSLKQSPLLWYRALDGVLLGAGWKKSQVDTALYFKVGDDKVTCWVLVCADDLLAASSSAAMLKKLKELLKAAFELQEISPVQKYLGLEIVRDRSVRKLWLHQQGYDPKLRRRFFDEEQNGRTTPVSVDTYATLTFNDEEAQVHQEEEYHKLGSGLTVRSDQHWCEVDRCLGYLANTRDTALEFGGGAESLKLVGYVDDNDVDDKQNRMSIGRRLLVEPAHQVCDAVVDRVGVRGGNQSRQGGTSPSLPPCRIPAAGCRDADCSSGGQQVGHHRRQGHGVDGQPQAHGWLHNMVKCGKFSLRYIPTAEQLADFLTKALHYPAFNWCSVAIDLVDVGDGDNDVQH